MKTKNVLKKFLGGGLALVMALGIFAGTGMDVRAADMWRVEAYTPPEDLSFEDLCRECIDDISIGDQLNEARDFAVKQMSTNDWAILLCYAETYGSVCVSTHSSPTITYTNAEFDTLHSSLKQLAESNSCFILRKNITPSTSEGTSNGEVSPTPHTHSYSWVTVQEANAGQDGIEEYRCSCGDVQERSVIPASAAIVDGFCNAVKNAPVDGIAEYDSGWWHTMSDYLIRELAKRPDVTTVITFEYERQMYKMTIPAGVDYTVLLADEDYFYGYFYFANAVGATIETIKTTQ